MMRRPETWFDTLMFSEVSGSFWTWLGCAAGPNLGTAHWQRLRPRCQGKGMLKGVPALIPSILLAAHPYREECRSRSLATSGCENMDCSYIIRYSLIQWIIMIRWSNPPGNIAVYTSFPRTNQTHQPCSSWSCRASLTSTCSRQWQHSTKNMQNLQGPLGILGDPR